MAESQPGELSRLAPGLDLTSEQRRSLAAILDVLASNEHSPTSIRDPNVGARLHLADSLEALKLEQVRRAETIADLGSGAGFPGLPLAVALPQAIVSLVDSQRRKCDFLERIRLAAGVENARVVCARAEEWPAGRSSNDVVVARALAAQPVVLEYAAPLLRMGGVLVDWRGRRSEQEERAGDRAARALGLQREPIKRMTAVEGATEHHLHLFVKVEETPRRFPRRPGMARKRPLG